MTDQESEISKIYSQIQKLKTENREARLSVWNLKELILINEQDIISLKTKLDLIK